MFTSATIRSLRKASGKLAELNAIDKKNEKIKEFRETIDSRLNSSREPMRNWLLANQEFLEDDLNQTAPGLYSKMLRHIDSLSFERIVSIDEKDFSLLQLLSTYVTNDQNGISTQQGDQDEINRQLELKRQLESFKLNLTAKYKLLYKQSGVLK